MPVANLRAPQLIACIELKQLMSLQAIADEVGVTQPTVWRWKMDEIQPIEDHLCKLRRLHDREVCEHTVIEYICDHPNLSERLVYEEAAFVDLVDLKELRSRPTIQETTTSVLKVIKILESEKLPETSDSKCYRVKREGPPEYWIVVRKGLDPEMWSAMARREITDHVLNDVSQRTTLPRFNGTRSIPVQTQGQRRTKKNADQLRKDPL